MLVIATRIAIGVLLIVAAVCDLRTFRIPNSIPFALLIVFGISALLGGERVLSPHIASFGIAGAISFALFVAHVWGGGDTKLSSAFALFLVPHDLGRFFLITSLSGGVLAVGILILRHWKRNQPCRNVGDIPYGLALAVGGLDWVLLR